MNVFKCDKLPFQVPHLRKTTLVIICGCIVLFALLMYMDEAKKHYNSMKQNHGSSLTKTLVDAFTGGDSNSDEICTRKLPSCIIIGAADAGMETIASFLELHPQVAIESGNFFSSNAYNKGLEWYRKYSVCRMKNQVTIAKSPNYFFSQTAPERIHRMNAKMKLILVVRSPIVRAWFHFLKEQNEDPEQDNSLTFSTSVYDPTAKSVIKDSIYLRRSIYSRPLERWLKYFRLGQILIVDGQDLDRNPMDILQKAEKFLNLSRVINIPNLYFNLQKRIYCLKTHSTVSEDYRMSCFKKQPKWEVLKIQTEVDTALQQYFKPFNDEFHSITGMELYW